MGSENDHHKKLKVLPVITEKLFKIVPSALLRRSTTKTMKVDVTVIAEFPEGMPPNVIAKLARATRHPAASQKTTVSCDGLKCLPGRPPRRCVAWKTDGIDFKQAIPDDVFQARMQAAAKYGIKLQRTIRRGENDDTDSPERGQTVFWTWGEGDLMELAPPPVR